MWDRFTPLDGRWYRWSLNGCPFYLRKNGEEWRSFATPVRLDAVTREAYGPEPCPEPPGTLHDIRVSPGSGVTLRPYMPERPFLLSATNSVSILPHSHAEFLVDLPVFFHLLTDDDAAVAGCIPFVLSNTWFGDKTGGTLCYSLRANLDPLCTGETGSSCEPDTAYRSLVRCGIRVENRSPAALEFRQLVVYTDLLRIWEANGYPKTDAIRVEGLSDGNLRMTVADAPLPAGARVLAPARMRQSELMVRRGVAFLRTITGM